MNDQKLLKVFNFLKENKINFLTIESVTGGKFVNHFSAIPGASSFLDGGIVTYSHQAKIKVLGIDSTLLENFGDVSSWTALEMVKKGKEILNSKLIISFTRKCWAYCYWK